MARTMIPTILLLPGLDIPAHSLRVSARRARMTLTFHHVATAAELKSRIQSHRPETIVTSPEGLPNLPVSAIRKLAMESEVPLLCVDRAASSELRPTGDSMRRITPENLPRALNELLHTRKALVAEGPAYDEIWARSLRENQKLIILGRVTASIVHEINNPLESITNLLFLLQEEPGLPEKAHLYLTMAQQELNRVAQISRQTLNFSRETSTPIKSQLDDLLEEVLSLYSRRITEKKLTIVRRFETHGSTNVYPGEMRQVFSNLIANAIEATAAEGRIEVRIRAARKWSDPKVSGLRITVADTGTGIPLTVRRRLGEPFFTTKGQQGTGLGLWVSQSIVERYGGSVQLRSSIVPEHHGTVFSIFLPTNLRPSAVSHQGEFEQARRVNSFKRPA
ncbi:MAG: HAMP domain-containing histidine kinase [Acidobacteria bacterium]|nr:HAMP domain-containing histidine kinase [Acidobacteriota bacterium]MBW4046258.1 HAMP domain-containing histidine kinase [Acidobacteriota bacterium]